MEKELKKETEPGVSYESKNSCTADVGNVATQAIAEIPENDGVLHIRTGGAVSITLNGEAVTIDSAGEHKISCPKGSTLALGEGPVIGIYRFDGTITGVLRNRPDLIFINNTTIILNVVDFFMDCSALENLDGTILECKYSVLAAVFRNTRIYKAPYIANTSKVVNLYGMFQNDENLVSVPLIDTSNSLTTSNMFAGCSNLSSVPLYDLSKVTNVKGMFFGCSSLKSLPIFDFSSAVTIESAFMKMKEMSEFPAGFNFDKVTNGLLAFAWDYGYGVEQADTYRAGNLLRFPAYSFPVCTSLGYAWVDQSVMCVMGKLNIPECTSLTGAFSGCYNLRHVYGFTGLKCDINMTHCTKLTRDSLVNIMTEAADVTAIGPRTMTFGATNLAKLSAAHKAIATDKGWTLL